MRTNRAVIFFVCASVACLFASSITHADTLDDQRAALQLQLAQVQSQILQNQALLGTQQKQHASLDNELSILDSQIKEAQLEIKQRDLTIQGLKSGIAESVQGIGVVDTHVTESQASLAQIIRDMQYADDTSFAEIALNGSLTDIFKDADDFAAIKQAMGNSFTKMATQRSDLSARKSALQDRQQEQSDLLKLQVAQQQSIKQTESQKQTLLNQTKGQESAYQQLIADQQKSAAQIQAALFSLANANKSVSFGDIYSYAKQAGAATNVRPALILGILAEESDLGQNVGSCTYVDAMNPARDVSIFFTLLQQLGLDPNSQKVSCKPSYGWGGAMGPAQFIPSTWVLYADRISQATGQNPPNPWDPRTAAFATAILMMDNGADAQTPDAERLAALRYLAGWKNATKAAYAFYGNDVMSLAAKYQQQIDVVNGS